MTLDFNENNVELVEDENVAIKQPPLRTSPEWNDYVLSQFVEEEIKGANPTVDGLRRVTELLVGNIVSTVSKVKQVPDTHNERTATVVVDVIVAQEDGTVLTASGVADAGPHNTQKEFKDHPSALAETRAEGRALRKLLRIRTIAAEESAQSNTPDIGGDSDAGVQPNQLSMINMMAMRANVNVQKLVDSFVSDGKLSNNNIRKLSQADGAILCQAISSLQSGEGAEDLRGYDENWRK